MFVFGTLNRDCSRSAESLFEYTLGRLTRYDGSCCRLVRTVLCISSVEFLCFCCLFKLLLLSSVLSCMSVILCVAPVVVGVSGVVVSFAFCG